MTTRQVTASATRDRASPSKGCDTLAPRDRIIASARRLFGAKGFYATTTAELAAAAAVSMGQIYRHFASKNDIVLAIVEENVLERVAEMDEIFDSVRQGRRTMFEGVKLIAEVSMTQQDGGLVYEIIAESMRNPSVRERMETLSACYRDGVRRLSQFARPDVSDAELEAYVDIMMACFFGLGIRGVMQSPTDVRCASESTACLLLRALGLSEEQFDTD